MVTNTAGWMRLSAEKAPLFVVSMALLPSDNKGQFAQCAAGAFDGYFRQIGANLQAHLVRNGGQQRSGRDRTTLTPVAG